jgi:hypothetical protein
VCATARRSLRRHTWNAWSKASDAVVPAVGASSGILNLTDPSAPWSTAPWMPRPEIGGDSPLLPMPCDLGVIVLWIAPDARSQPLDGAAGMGPAEAFTGHASDTLGRTSMCICVSSGKV